MMRNLSMVLLGPLCEDFYIGWSYIVLPEGSGGRDLLLSLLT